MEYMLDTNICIYIIKRRPPEVIRRFRESDVSRIGISSITLRELFYGASKSAYSARNRIGLTRFAAPLKIAPYYDEAAERYGYVRADLEKQGLPIGALDMLLAAHALFLGCTVVTNNTREFSRVPTLKIDKWITSHSSRTPSNLGSHQVKLSSAPEFRPVKNNLRISISFVMPDLIRHPVAVSY